MSKPTNPKPIERILSGVFVVFDFVLTRAHWKPASGAKAEVRRSVVVVKLRLRTKSVEVSELSASASLRSVADVGAAMPAGGSEGAVVVVAPEKRFLGPFSRKRMPSLKRRYARPAKARRPQGAVLNSASAMVPAGGMRNCESSPYSVSILRSSSEEVPKGKFLRRIMRSSFSRPSKAERSTPCFSRKALVSWMTWVSAWACRTAASEEVGSRRSALETPSLLATEEITASAYAGISFCDASRVGSKFIYIHVHGIPVEGR